MDEMATSLDDLEELVLCFCCKHVFNETERPPKMLSCKHYFCLVCTRSVLEAGREVRCVHCWKQTELPEGGAEALPTHTAILALARRMGPDPLCTVHSLPALWCTVCGLLACRACDHAHHAHALRPTHEVRALLQRENYLLQSDLWRMNLRERGFLLCALEAATAFKTHLIANLTLPLASFPHERSTANVERCSLEAATAEHERLRNRHADALIQYRLDHLIRNANIPLDFELLRRALSGVGVGETSPISGNERRDPLLFLANYCMGQLYTRNFLIKTQQLNGAGALEADKAPEVASPSSSPAALGSQMIPWNPSTYPLFYFNLEVNGTPFGRIVIEVREDLAPRMARNFAVLTSGERGIGYSGCAVFQCWENESIITGDFELNNGRGGRSVFEESYFMPDDTNMKAVRGSVGMRRTQKRLDNLRLVGSQFRIMLCEIPSFTAIFAFVVEGIELVEHLSQTGDSAGKPHCSIIIASCGKLN